MTEDGTKEELRPARRRLAERLRELRTAAELTGTELARAAGWAQSKVSRLETGTTVPQIADVSAWARVTDASDEQRAELLELTEGALIEAADWRDELREGRASKQRRYGQLERSVSTLREWEPLIVPGLLQTAEYARRVFGFASEAPWDIGEAVKARMDNQSVLFDQSKRFEFLVGEAALRRRVGPPAVLLGQLDRIGSLLDLPNIEIGLVPLDAEVTTLDYHGFVVFGDTSRDESVFVLVETVADELTVRDAEKAGIYLAKFARLRDGACFGAEARAFLAALGERLQVA